MHFAQHMGNTLHILEETPLFLQAAGRVRLSHKINGNTVQHYNVLQVHYFVTKQLKHLQTQSDFYFENACLLGCCAL
jgi:hypothetical protein